MVQAMTAQTCADHLDYLIGECGDEHPAMGATSGRIRDGG